MSISRAAVSKTCVHCTDTPQAPATPFPPPGAPHLLSSWPDTALCSRPWLAAPAAAAPVGARRYMSEKLTMEPTTCEQGRHQHAWGQDMRDVL